MAVAGRRLLQTSVGLKAKAGTWPATGQQSQSETITNARGFSGVLDHTPEFAHTFSESVTAVTVRVPHDGDLSSNTVTVSLHGRASDPDAFTVANNDPYTPAFHDPYSGSAGASTDDGPQAQISGYTQDSTPITTFSAGTGQNKATLVGAGNGPTLAAKHDPLKLSWSCTGSAMAQTQSAPAVAHQTSTGHAQGYRKSTGQRTQGNEVFMTDERASCTTTADTTGYKPACLVHAVDQPPATTWGTHALQDGPDITLTLTGNQFPSTVSKTATCTMTATDPYGKMSTTNVVITVQPEVNAAPVGSWKTGGVTTYTVPHDHSPLTNEVQVLLDGTFTDADDNAANVGPLGNDAVETTESAQRRGTGVNEQLKWEGTRKGADSSSWAMFRGMEDPNTAVNSGARQPSEAYGNDKHTFKWTCPTCTKGNCISNELRPTVSLPGPPHAQHATGTWAAGGGQVGQLAAGQWGAASLSHTCTLVVTDSYGSTHSYNKVIVVNREPNTFPTVDVSGTATAWTVPHDFNSATNTVKVTLKGHATPDADNDRVKHKWVCVSGGTQTAIATVELPFPVQCGGYRTGFTKHSSGGIQTGAADPKYVASASAVQTSTGWGDDQGNSGNGDLFMCSHGHDSSQVDVHLQAGTHTCTLTTTDTYNEAKSGAATITVTAESSGVPSR